MKKIALSLFLAALLCVLAACPNSMPDNSVTINGTVTITRNGIPWNRDNFSAYSYSRAAPPPTDRPIISAYYKGGGGIDSASVYYQPDGDDYRNGTYQWRFYIPADKLPCSVYFTVRCRMSDVASDLRTTTEEFWIQDKNTVVDIGVINFDVVRLSGNLPITINNEPFDNNGYYDGVAIGQMNIFNLSVYHFISEVVYHPHWSAYIRPNGDWSLNIKQPDSEIPLEFQVEVRRDGGFLRKTLNPGNAVTIYDTDKEFVFPDYPSVNLEAFHLSGTIEVVSPGTSESRYHISFYREGAKLHPPNYTSDNVLITQLLSDITTEWSVPGLKKWKTTIPAMELPYELIYSFLFDKGGDAVYKGHSSVIITGDTDLSNINLGVFTFE